MKIRIKFTKHGATKFIGHLDIMRYFQKAMRRADIDIKYSEGFSPHQVMSFAAPLGVGLTSNGEYLDIEVNTAGSLALMKEKLNQAMAEGISVISCRKLVDSSKNAMSMVACADYTLTFRDSARPDNLDDFFRGFKEFCSRDSILITKKTKKSERELDIKPFIYEALIEGETIFLKLSTGSADNLKPELVMEAYYQSLGSKMPDFAFQIQREEVYGDIGGENGHNFISLENLGEEVE